MPHPRGQNVMCLTTGDGVIADLSSKMIEDNELEVANTIWLLSASGNDSLSGVMYSKMMHTGHDSVDLQLPWLPVPRICKIGFAAVAACF